MKSYLGTGAASRRWTWWVAAAAIAVAARGGYSLSTVPPRGLPYVTGALALALLAVAAVAGLLARGGPARGLLLYVAALVAVGAPSFVAMVRLVILDPACSTMGAFSTRGELVDRGLTVLLASLLFGAAATALYGGAGTSGDRATSTVRRRLRRGVLLVGGAMFAYQTARFASYFIEAAADAIPGAWTSCVRATASGISDLPLTVGIDLVSGFEEEIAFTGIALLVLGRAPRARSAAQFAVVGALLRAVMHFYYTVEAPWWSFLSVIAWTLAWSGLTLLGCYLVLRLTQAWTVPAVAAVTLGAATAHSVMNLDNGSVAIATALSDQGHAAAGGAFIVALALLIGGPPLAVVVCGVGPLICSSASRERAMRALRAEVSAPARPAELGGAIAPLPGSEDREPESAG
ncbi:hypothetical protein [Tsukamurella spumae]|uniref:Uncharacterized protein n=1 Tax=Tsukamurella spumae TaxID=44753 RepID=A0A846X1V9_9ACTN|nr:hypothetical protein [Tsukamurella spumae]NKY19478.1 hypothetical protein [Tsukamurella spumae]